MMHKNEIIWGAISSEYQEFTVRNVPFRLVFANYHAHKTTSDCIVILKSKDLLASEMDVFDKLAPANVVELGLFEGGSAILWHLLYGVKYLGVDILPEPTAIRQWIDKLGLSHEITLRYSTSQDDEAKILEAIKTTFAGAPIDLVIDDASHQYLLSRRSFEILFPLVRAGGIYCIEDWPWAHADHAVWQEQKLWGDMPALTNLIFDIVMLYGSKREWIDQISISKAAAYVFSTGKAPKVGFSLDKSILKQGRTFTPI
jgi:cephalosporin hydroxylase